MITPDGKCSNCGKEVPKGDIACRACALQASWEAEWKRQYDYLPQVAKGDLALRLARPTGERQTHVMLFGSDYLTYCGAAFPSYTKRTRLFLAQAYREQNRICRTCFAKLTDAMEERGAA